MPLSNVGTWDTTATGTLYTDFVIGGLGNDYFCTYNAYLNPLDGEYWSRYQLRSIADPATLLDNVSWGPYTDRYEPWGSSQDAAGNCWLIRQDWDNNENFLLSSVSQSGGTITVADIGYPTMTRPGTYSSSYFGGLSVWASNDTTEIVIQDKTWGGTATPSPLPRGVLRGVDTSDASQNWSLDMDALTGHTPTMLGVFGPDRVLLSCSTHSELELWGGGSLLDSIATYWTPTGREATPVSNDLALVWRSGSGQLSAGRLSATSDVLAWEWGPTAFSSGWGASVSAATRSFDTAVIAVPDGSSSGSALWTIDATTGTITATGTDSSVGEGMYSGHWRDLAAASSNGFAVAGVSGSGYTWSLVPTQTGVKYLRLRQSPVYTPSRVRPIDLRQRQTPIVNR